MGGKAYLGELEHMVLAAALRLGQEAYGAAIIKEIGAETGRSVPSGSLSITVDRLESKGYVQSQMGESDSSRGGRPKRYVSITKEGVTALADSRAAMMNLWQGLETHLEER
jgi:DNA-binding PadR family transcriptional regulator